MTVTSDLVVETFNNIFFPELKKYVEDNSIYKPLVMKSKPSVSKIFPIVSVKLLPSQNTYGNLSYTEEKFSFGIEIDINAKDSTIDNVKESKRKICEEITSHIVKYFKEHYRVITYINHYAISTDDEIGRTIMRITGIISTIYGLEKLVVYPR